LPGYMPPNEEGIIFEEKEVEIDTKNNTNKVNNKVNNKDNIDNIDNKENKENKIIKGTVLGLDEMFEETPSSIKSINKIEKIGKEDNAHMKNIKKNKENISFISESFDHINSEKLKNRVKTEKQLLDEETTFNRIFGINKKNENYSKYIDNNDKDDNSRYCDKMKDNELNFIINNNNTNKDITNNIDNNTNNDNRLCNKQIDDKINLLRANQVKKEQIKVNENIEIKETKEINEIKEVNEIKEIIETKKNIENKETKEIKETKENKKLISKYLLYKRPIEDNNNNNPLLENKELDNDINNTYQKKSKIITSNIITNKGLNIKSDFGLNKDFNFNRIINNNANNHINNIANNNTNNNINNNTNNVNNNIKTTKTYSKIQLDFINNKNEQLEEKNNNIKNIKITFLNEFEKDSLYSLMGHIIKHFNKNRDVSLFSVEYFFGNNILTLKTYYLIF